MGNAIQISRSLYDKLAPHLEHGQDIDSLLEDLLFEVPDEAMERYMAHQNPVTVEVGLRVADLIESMSRDFGLSPVGLTILLSDVFDKTMALKKRYEDHVTRGTE